MSKGRRRVVNMATATYTSIITEPPTSLSTTLEKTSNSETVLECITYSVRLNNQKILIGTVIHRQILSTYTCSNSAQF